MPSRSDRELLRHQAFVAGEWREGERRTPITDPATGEPLAGAAWKAVAPYTREAQTHRLAEVIRSLDPRPAG